MAPKAGLVAVAVRVARGRPPALLRAPFPRRPFRPREGTAPGPVPRLETSHLTLIRVESLDLD